MPDDSSAASSRIFRWISALLQPDDFTSRGKQHLFHIAKASLLVLYSRECTAHESGAVPGRCLAQMRFARDPAEFSNYPRSPPFVLAKFYSLAALLCTQNLFIMPRKPILLRSISKNESIGKRSCIDTFPEIFELFILYP